MSDNRTNPFEELAGALPIISQPKKKERPKDTAAIDKTAATTGYVSRNAKPEKQTTKHIQVDWNESDWFDLEHAKLAEGKPSTKDFLLKCFRFYMAHKGSIT